jgi:hypothetical protein
MSACRGVSLAAKPRTGFPDQVRARQVCKKAIRRANQKTCPALRQKIFRLTCRANHLYKLAPSRPARGALRNVTNVVRDAVDARAARDERSFSRTAKSCGLDAPTLASSRWKQVSVGDGGKKAGHRGERGVSRKPSRREGRSVSAEPVCSCAPFYVHLAHETAGAARTRSSLRPLISGRAEISRTTRAIMRRERGRMQRSLRGHPSRRHARAWLLRMRSEIHSRPPRMRS